MYTWGYIKEVALAKLDFSNDEALQIGLLNKFPFYANEAITQISSSIKAKATFATFNAWDKSEYLGSLKNFYHISEPFDFNFLWKTRECNVEDLPLSPYDMQKMWHSFHDNNIVFTDEIVKMPKDFINFGDDINRVIKLHKPYCGYEECLDSDWSTMGSNSVMFKEPGKYLLSYDARWYTFDPTTPDEEELDIPDDVVEAIPSYIVSQCYKIDDEAKANTYAVEFERMCARIEDNKARTNKTIHIGGGW